MPTLTVELRSDATNELLAVARFVLKDGLESTVRNSLLRLQQHYFPERSLEAQFMQPLLRQRLADLRAGRDAVLSLVISPRPDRPAYDATTESQQTRQYTACLVAVREGLSDLDQPTGPTLDAQQYRRAFEALRARKEERERQLQAVGRALAAAGVAASAPDAYAEQITALAQVVRAVKARIEELEVDIENLKGANARLAERLNIQQRTLRQLEQDNKRLKDDLLGAQSGGDG